MLITLFSDASLCPNTRTGGWAGWLKSEVKTVRGGGPFRRLLNDTSIAEAMAVVNTLHLGTKQGVISPGDTVLVQTDNDSIASVLEGTAKRKLTATTRIVEDVARTFCTLVTGMEITIRWRHVKAHRGTVDRRSAVNDYCDEQSREHMRQARRNAPHWSKAPECAALPEDVGIETATQSRKRRRKEMASGARPSEGVSNATVQAIAKPPVEAASTPGRTQLIMPMKRAVAPTVTKPIGIVTPPPAPAKKKAPAATAETSKPKKRRSNRRRASARRKRTAAAA